MKAVITPCNQLRGTLRVPGDRSITVRAVLCGAIADGMSIVREPLDCDDTRAAIDCMRALGVDIQMEQAPSRSEARYGERAVHQDLPRSEAGYSERAVHRDVPGSEASSSERALHQDVPGSSEARYGERALHQDPTHAEAGYGKRALHQDVPGSEARIHGVGLRGLRPSANPLFCNSSGTTMRLLAGLMAGQAFGSRLDGSLQLRKRPMRRITDPLNSMGATIASVGDCAPLTITPGRLHGIDYVMPVASAQVKSALLLAALYADGDVVIHESSPTRDHTERMLMAMGAPIETASSDGRVTMHHRVAELRPLDMTVPADFSSAAFFLIAGLLLPEANLTLTDVGLNPTRTGLLEALRAMGAVIQIDHFDHQGGEPVGDIRPMPGPLQAIEIGGNMASLMIDEFPIFAVAATQAHGVTIVRDAQELRVKESNRIEGLVDELRKMGASIEATADGFIVNGPTRLHGATVDALGDHRMAMALSVAGLITDSPTTIIGADCVSKTYPAFFDDLRQLAQPSDIVTES